MRGNLQLIATPFPSAVNTVIKKENLLSQSLKKVTYKGFLLFIVDK